jgi:hypothetical protein
MRGATMMTDEDRKVLRAAVERLEHPSLAGRFANIVGKPIEFVGLALPAGTASVISAASERALGTALKIALATMQNRPEAGSQRLHKALATAAGAIGGSLGLASAPIELPISTIIMIRSIAAIARSEGESLSDPDTALACVQVFALGGRTGAADVSESGYFAVRALLARSVTEAARFIATTGMVEEQAPVLVRFLTQVASRFGLVVSEKLAAQTVPIIGALGGAAVNYAFIEHFQDVARGHFAVRRLERIYGKETVRAEYERAREKPAARQKHPELVG